MKKKIFFLLLFVVALLLFLVFADRRENYEQVIRESMMKYNPPKRNYVILIDYRKHLFAKRLFLFDLKNKKEIVSSRVAHAFNSGIFYAGDFSNENESRKSCSGAFVTADAYQGQYGYAMRVNGLDKGINDQAMKRAIVFHSVGKMPVLWSWGCFVTSPSINRSLIDLTKGGNLVIVLK